MIYKERLWPSLALLLVGMLLLPAFYLMFAPISQYLAVLFAIAGYGLYVLFLIATSPRVTVDATTLVAGRARIPLTALGDVIARTPSQTRALLSTESDARAYLLIRSWIPNSVQVEVSDTTDATPYWLISSRKPRDLIRAIEASRQQRS